MDSVLVLARELHVAVLDLAPPRDLLMDALDVALQIAKAEEGVVAAVAVVFFDVRVLEKL